MKCWATTFSILALLSATLALAEDFKTLNGKVYKDATVSRVEPDGIVLRTKRGISKVYFVELPKDVQERFHYAAAKTAAPQPKREPIKVQPKQSQSPQPAKRGRAGALQVSPGFVRLLTIAAVVIAGVVLLIIRRRY